MTVPREELILLLRDGLDSTDWPKVAASRKSLHARICYLRREGFTITATRLHQDRYKTKGHRPVRYMLTGNGHG